MTPAGVSSQPIRLWPPQGRMGRLRFFYYVVAAWVLSTLVALPVAALMSFSGADPKYVQFAAVALFYGLAVTVMILRSHDMDLAGWWGLLALVPFAALYWLGKSGTPGPNRFGAPPPPNTTADRIKGWLAGVVVAIVVIAAAAFFLFISLIFGGGR